MMKPLSRWIITGGVLILAALWAGLLIALPAGAQTEPPPVTTGTATLSATPEEAIESPSAPNQTPGPILITGPTPTGTQSVTASPSPTPAGSIQPSISGGWILLIFIGALLLLGALILAFILVRLLRRLLAPPTPKVAIRPGPTSPPTEPAPAADPAVATTVATTLALADPKGYLTLLSAPGGHFALGAARVTIGRAAGNQMVLPNDVPGMETVSRFHAAISWQNGAHIIEDLESQNGILVNGRATAKNVLKDGDELQLGNVKYQYHRGEPAPQQGENQS